jgi:N-glycosylase/DNA lyase
MTELLRREFNLNEQNARALAMHWESFSPNLFTETDEQELIRNIGRFLTTLSTDTVSAEKKLNREKKIRDRSIGKKNQLTIFPADPDDSEISN